MWANTKGAEPRKAEHVSKNNLPFPSQAVLNSSHRNTEMQKWNTLTCSEVFRNMVKLTMLRNQGTHALVSKKCSLIYILNLSWVGVILAWAAQAFIFFFFLFSYSKSRWNIHKKPWNALKSHLMIKEISIIIKYRERLKNHTFLYYGHSELFTGH